MDKIDYENGKVRIEDKVYSLNDKNFPTINRDDPYKLSDEEEELMERLRESFLRSKELQRHIDFMYAKGSIYKVFNSNLLFHGCIPMDEDGEFVKVKLSNKVYSGKEFLDYMEKLARKSYSIRKIDKEGFNDIMWYLWCSYESPLFGKDKAATA